jgi:Mg2+/Co2+ transporter CorB
MAATTIIILLISLVVLIFLSGFFSSSETAMMALNRYRLRHLAGIKNRSAVRVSKLLERPDRLLGVILIGNTFANVLASSLATVLAVYYFGDAGIAIAPFILTFIILIFAEVAPKTFAAAHSQRLAFIVALPLVLLLKIFYPIVWIVNFLANGLLKLLRVRLKRDSMEHLTSDELGTLVKEAGDKIPDSHQNMLLAILELEKVTVDDIMIPRNDIVGIDLENDWGDIHKRITCGEHTRMPVYMGDIDNIKGMLHVRKALNLLSKSQLTKQTILESLNEPYFIPEGTPLHTQLLNFRSVKMRTAFVVNEYGDIEGLATLEDILEEIVGEFTTDIPAIHKEIKKQADGSYIVDAAITVRELNKQLQTNFDTSGPKTLSGLIIEELEMIPRQGVGLKISGYPLEVLRVENNRIEIVRIIP